MSHKSKSVCGVRFGPLSNFGLTVGCAGRASEPVTMSAAPSTKSSTTTERSDKFNFKTITSRGPNNTPLNRLDRFNYNDVTWYWYELIVYLFTTLIRNYMNDVYSRICALRSNASENELWTRRLIINIAKDHETDNVLVGYFHKRFQI